jgi:predicted Zn-dependent protease
LVADPTQPDAAANLAGLLVATGRAAEALPLLERALSEWPRHAVGWTNLVVAYAASGDRELARDAARRASAFGVTLNPELLATVEGTEGP